MIVDRIAASETTAELSADQRSDSPIAPRAGPHSGEDDTPAHLPMRRRMARRRKARDARRDGSEGAVAAVGKRMHGDIGALRALRAAPSPMVPLGVLAEEVCLACGAVDLQVGRYPAYKSPVFAGQLLLQCRCCGLAWVPGDTLDLAAFYEADYSEGYRAERGRDGAFYSDDNPAWSRPVHKVRDRARRQAETLAHHGPFERVLDIGAGEGMFLHALPPAEKWAVEPDRHGRRILQEELGVHLTTLPEAALGRAGGPFDLVTASHVLEHLMADDILPTLESARAALRPGGLFFAEVPAGADQLIAFATGRRPPRARMEPHTLFYSALSLVRLVRKAGFAVLELGPCGWTSANVPGEVLREIAGGADHLADGPLTLLARAP
jgi:SAM-dependent methyltransferase